VRYPVRLDLLPSFCSLGFDGDANVSRDMIMQMLAEWLCKLEQIHDLITSMDLNCVPRRELKIVFLKMVLLYETPCPRYTI
jgi:hypothetical protein